MAVKYPATKPPTGLSITRNGFKFTFKWKLADANYGAGLKIKYYYYRSKQGVYESAWINLDTRATEYTITLSESAFYPVTRDNGLTWVSFFVGGTRQYEETSRDIFVYQWAISEGCTYNVYNPNAPTLTEALNSQSDNQTTFTWKVTKSDTDARPFHSVEWQSRRIPEDTGGDGPHYYWGSGVDGWITGTSTEANSSYTITEDPTLLSQRSQTRWFRIRSRGAGYTKSSKQYQLGSDWTYIKHVYGKPLYPLVREVKLIDGTPKHVSVTFTATFNLAHPIDSEVIEYCIATPAAGLEVPENARWTVARTITNYTGSSRDTVNFDLPSSIGLDQCLWVRAGATHDRTTSYSPGQRPLDVIGRLTQPGAIGLDIDTVTHRVTVSATNRSSVPDSQLAVIFRRKGQKDLVVGIIPHGSTSVTVQCPDWGSDPVAFGAYAFQGTATSKAISGGVSTYSIKANMISDEQWSGGNVPLAPTNVTAEATETAGEVMLTWTWAWTEANRTELSWSQNPNAWESTDEPSTYMITNLHAAQWRVSGLDTGAPWYFRIRLAQETDGETVFGPYCDPIEVDLSSVPNTPVLLLNKGVIVRRGAITASWAYVSTDNSPQSYAEICEATVNGGSITYGDIIAHTTTPLHVSFTAPASWAINTVHQLCVRVTSSSGKVSDWSEPIAIAVANPMTCSISQTSLVPETITEGGDTREIMALTVMPLTVTVTGAGQGNTTLILERASEYHVIRPDESTSDGYEGETIALVKQTGEAQITIEQKMLIGALDDGAPYRLIAMTEDGFGQTATDTLDFEVHWAHQAVVPEAVSTIDIDNGIAILTPIAPEGFIQGDVCDIYRLSSDKPTLIVQDGVFGTEYVDPYPTIGETGGYRFVYRTINGDYITDDNAIAWLDLPANIDDDATLINFGSDRVALRYNMDISHSWDKDFVETTYLGGSIQGDWNPAIHRSTSVSVDYAIDEDADQIENMRRLAAYNGICHVRTVDGSTFAADVQVSESRSYDSAGKIVSFNVAITQVDGQTLDGVPYDEWSA